MKTPRQRFLETKFAKAHADLAASEGFLTACEYAILQFVHELPIPHPFRGDGPHCDAHAQLVGAKRLVDIISTLGDPIQPPKKIEPETLNYNLKK